MIVVALRCFIFFGIIVAYSAGVWNLINGYFGKEFHAYMAKHPERPIPPRLQPGAGLGNESSGATEIDAVAISALLESAPCGDFREEGEKLCKMMDQVQRPRTEEVDDGDDDSAADNSVFVADGDLIISSALNHNPIDETWWSNYWGEKDFLLENRSAEHNDKDQGFCPLHPTEEESCRNE